MAGRIVDQVFFLYIANWMSEIDHSQLNEFVIPFDLLEQVVSVLTTEFEVTFT